MGWYACGGLVGNHPACASAAQRNPCRKRGMRLPVQSASRRPRPHGATARYEGGAHGACTETGHPCPLRTPPQIAMQCSGCCGMTGPLGVRQGATTHGRGRQVCRSIWGAGGLLAWPGIPAAHDAPAAISHIHRRDVVGPPTVLYAHDKLRVTCMRSMADMCRRLRL